MCSVERIATEWRTFFAFDHCRSVFADAGEEGRLEPEIWKLSEW
jgi:hypothetical protein